MRVVVAFADSSLGGTSRSALLFADLWLEAGADVLVYSPHELHEQRRSEVQAKGIRVTTSLSDVSGFSPRLAHLHHAAPSVETISWVGAFDAVLADDVVVLTHNVFGQPLPLSPGRQTVVGVLGDWVAAQYGLQSQGVGHAVRVMPNPQDFDYFRPPTEHERERARADLGIEAGDFVVLRAGSPSEAKWSRSAYASLARVIEATPGVRGRLIGAPSTFDFEATRLVIIHESLGDSDLRREYWAADVFAHWAARGESFGNVILEALGTGLPVVYRAVRTRDNTPAEFRDLSGFEYVTSARAWKRRILAFRAGAQRLYDGKLRRYSSRQVLTRLRSIVTSGNKANASEDIFAAILAALPEPVRLPVRERTVIALRHNPLMALLKRRRLRSRR